MHLLEKPETIYQEVITHFPFAKLIHTLDHHHVTLEIKLSSHLNSIFLHSAVPLSSLSSTLTYLSLHSHLQDKNKVYQIDLLSTETRLSPLPCWQKFQRSLYIKNGFCCVELIKKFISEKSDQHLLFQIEQLGLAPEFIKEEASEELLSYFIQLLEGISEEEQNKVMMHLKERHYSDGFLHKLLVHKAQKDIGDYKKNHSLNKNTYETLMKQLSQAIIGQKYAVEIVTGALIEQTFHSNLSRQNYSFLFIGPPGVGKTELAKTIAHSGEKKFILLNMQQYADEHSLSNLLGSPIGYVGSTDKPALAKLLDKHTVHQDSTKDGLSLYTVKDVVLVFDELEKAHFKIRQALLGLFETTGEGSTEVTIQYSPHSYGSLSSNNKIIYRLTQSIVIGTSNLYQQFILNAFHQKLSLGTIIQGFKEKNIHSPDQGYSQEFLSRVTVVPFGPIPRGSAYQLLLEKKLETFFVDLKMSLGFKELSILQKNTFLNDLEQILYGNGADLRKIPKYFKLIKDRIRKHMASFGDPKNTRLIFYSTGVRKKIEVISEYFILGKYVKRSEISSKAPSPEPIDITPIEV